DRYVEPGRVTFWHVFLADDRRRPGVTRDAEGLLARLRTDATSPAEAVRLGDVFPPGPRFRGQSAADLTRLFGPDFARATLALEPFRGSATAHALSPALLEIEELAGERVAVAWKISVFQPTGAALEPVLPPDCVAETPPADTAATDSITTRWTAHCPGGLVS